MNRNTLFEFRNYLDSVSDDEFMQKLDILRDEILITPTQYGALQIALVRYRQSRLRGITAMAYWIHTAKVLDKDVIELVIHFLEEI